MTDYDNEMEISAESKPTSTSRLRKVLQVIIINVVVITYLIFAIIKYISRRKI